jgi:hypothetical protein
MPLNGTPTIYILEENYFLGCDTLAEVYQSTRYHIPEDNTFHSHCHNNLKSNFYSFYLLRIDNINMEAMRGFEIETT